MYKDDTFRVNGFWMALRVASCYTLFESDISFAYKVKAKRATLVHRLPKIPEKFLRSKVCSLYGKS